MSAAFLVEGNAGSEDFIEEAVDAPSVHVNSRDVPGE